MLDVVQTSTPAPAPSAALPAAAGNDNDAKITGFQAIMGKAMGAEEKPTEKPGEEGEAQADGNALLPSPGEHLPTDGIPLPVATTMPAAVVTPVAPPPTDADVQTATLEGALAEGTELPVDAGGRLADLLRRSLKTEKSLTATPSATPQMPATPALPAAAAAIQPTANPVIAAGEAAGKLAAQGLQLDTAAAAATSIINVDTPASYQNTAAFTTALTHAGLAPAAPQANSAAPVPLAVPTPVQQPQWGDDLGDRVVWMVKQDIKSADIRLNPPHLGPLEVKISMAHDQVSVSFSSHHAVVREALDTAMPRLREMMTDNGLQLTNANVSNKSASDHQGGSQHYAGGGRVSGGEDDGASGADGGVLNSAASSSLSRYLVDYYA